MFGIASYIVGITIFASGIWICLGKQINYIKVAKATFAVMLFLTAIHIFFAPTERQVSDLIDPSVMQRYGGFIGGQISYLLVGLIGRFGARILMILPVIGGILVIVDKPLPELLAPIEAIIVRFLRDTSSNAAARAAAMKASSASAKQSSSRAQDRVFGGQQDNDEDDYLAPEPSNDPVKPPAKRKEFVRSPDLQQVSGGNVTPEVVPSTLMPGKSLFDLESEPQTSDVVGDDGTGGAGDPPKPTEPVSKLVFQMPSTSLLAPAVPLANPQAGASEARRQRIIQCLEDFGIGAEIERISYGPTITRYEVALERGIKVSKIVSLADNLAMDLAAIDVRVEAPIPGRSAIGIEVPTDTPTPVMLRECLESPEFKNAAGRLTFVLGKDVTGNVRVADLAKMPHLLVGGSTGSGKSVGLNVLITSLIYRNSPRELKFLMRLLRHFLVVERDELASENIRLVMIGEREGLPPDVLAEMDRTVEMTRNNTGMTLALAVNYGGRTEIAKAARRIAEKVARGELLPSDINESLFDQHLDTAGMPDPDLLIRTAGEMRVSNYLLWQISYSELWVTETNWPDFREDNLAESFHAYAGRKRKFGGLIKS